MPVQKRSLVNRIDRRVAKSRGIQQNVKQDEGFNVREVNEAKEEYARVFERIALAIRQGDDVPKGAYIMIFRGNGEIERHRNFVKGFNLLEAVGALTCAKDDMSHEIRRSYGN